MRKKSRRTGSVCCCEVINTRPGPGWRCHCHPTGTATVPGALGILQLPPQKQRPGQLFSSLNHRRGHLCVCLGPSKSNIPADLCPPGSLCTPRQTGIFSGVCSHSRKNSQMGITLPRGTGWMSFIYNAGQQWGAAFCCSAPEFSLHGEWSCDFFGFSTAVQWVWWLKSLVCGVRCKWELSRSDSDPTWSPECEI